MAPNAPSAVLSLADHVRACRCGDQVILLDLMNGRYLKPALSDSGGQEAVAGWPPDTVSGPDSTKPSGQVSENVLRLLRARKLVAWMHDEPRPAPRHDVAACTLDIESSRHRIGARDLGAFTLSLAVATARLRLASLYAISQWLPTCRRTERSGMLDEAIATFNRLRPIVFTARDRCLFDSLALSHFLARRGFDTRWIVGVRTAPFRAHSWVQQGSVVLNDLHENVLRFEPILIV